MRLIAQIRPLPRVHAFSREFNSESYVLYTFYLYSLADESRVHYHPHPFDSCIGHHKLYILMLFSRKNILTRGRKPLYAATKVINASSASASSAFAKCWVHSTNKTSALLRTVRSRAYPTRDASESNSGSGGFQTGSKFGLPFYRAFTCFHLSQSVHE